VAPECADFLSSATGYTSMEIDVGSVNARTSPHMVVAFVVVAFWLLDIASGAREAPWAGNPAGSRPQRRQSSCPTGEPNFSGR